MDDRCVFCGVTIPGGGAICPECRPELKNLPPEEQLAALWLDYKRETAAIIIPAVEKFVECVSEFLAKSIKAVTDALYKLVGASTLLQINAVTWAENERPEWVRIMRRTKKRRTRKKYMNRIMREYLRRSGHDQT